MVTAVLRLLSTLMILALPLEAFAQEAILTGTIRDNTGGVLPGVTVTAVQEATGNTFTAVTGSAGAYRLPVRPGTFRITAELPGFITLIRPGVELLLGQTATLNFEMGVTGVAESVTVSGEAPLLEVASSSLGGNIDPRQMQELPLSGRNWMDLSMLAPGSRRMESGDNPGIGEAGYAQINVDGQQVTTLLAGATQQPRFSRDSIAEFELVTNRFDATQGRSGGVQVNAITKSGTNTFQGTFSGFFRDDAFNAKDLIEKRVLPYSNQQYSATFGGPFRRDRLHFFSNYEYEREPQVAAFRTPYPSFNMDLPGTRDEKKGGGRIDWQLSPAVRLMGRASYYDQFLPFYQNGGGNVHPSAASSGFRKAYQVYGQLTQVLNNRTVNEVKVGTAPYHWQFDNYVLMPGGQRGTANFLTGTRPPRIQLRGLNIGANTNSPQDIKWTTSQVRDDFTTSYEVGGHHDVKVGGEYLRTFSYLLWCSSCNGNLVANRGAPPSFLESLFPVWNDPSTWNLNPLAPNSVRYRRSIYREREINNPRNLFGVWYQDDWRLTQRLTLNLGVRYDVDQGGTGEGIELYPWMDANRPTDKNNVAPRIGFAYSLDDRTVLRGGYGVYYVQGSNDSQHNPTLARNMIIPEVVYDGRADFPTNPFKGPAPTYDQVSGTLCSATNVPGCVRRDIPQEVPPDDYVISYSHQVSAGIQRQLGPVMMVESDFTYTGARRTQIHRNINMSYNPATGANYPFSDISHRPFPEFGAVNGRLTQGYGNYYAMQSAFTKRFRDDWQATVSYTLSWDRGSDGPVCAYTRNASGRAECSLVTFALAPDVGDDYGLQAGDQRHRLVANGIWEVGAGFQVSGLYLFGSGERRSTSFGGDLRDMSLAPTNRLRPDGTVAPKADFVGDPIHRVDLRVSRRFSLAGARSVTGFVEVFNAFNHANYGSYTTDLANALYGQPSFNSNIAYQPRTAQFGFRFTF